MRIPYETADKPFPLNDLSAIRKTSASGFVLRIFVLVVLGIVATAGIVESPGICCIPFQILMALLLAHGTELAHQALHRTGTGSVFWDRALGTALCWPTVIAFNHYKWFHLWHHSANGRVDDAESFGYAYQMMQAKGRLTRLAGFARHAFMLDHYGQSLRRLLLAVCGRLVPELRKGMPQMSPSAARQIQIEYRVMAVLYIAVVSASLAVGTDLLLRVWLIPLLLWAPIHALIELPEHWATAPRPHGNAFENTRTVQASPLATWFTNSNNFHCEHHAFSAVPMQALPALHAALLRSGIQHRYLVQGYAPFFASFVRTLWTGKL